MKTAPLHFKINYLAIEQQKLINDGNKFVMEIYVLVTQNRAMGMLKWGGRKGIQKKKKYLNPKGDFSQIFVEPISCHLFLGCHRLVETWPPGHQGRSQAICWEMLPTGWEGVFREPIKTVPISSWWLGESPHSPAFLKSSSSQARLGDTTNIFSELPPW